MNLAIIARHHSHLKIDTRISRYFTVATGYPIIPESRIFLVAFAFSQRNVKQYGHNDDEACDNAEEYPAV